MKNRSMKRLRLLRFLSALFALGIIAAGIGFGAKTYLDRTLDNMAEEGILRNEALADHPLRQALDGQEIKEYVREFFPVIYRQDEAGLEGLVRKSMDLMIQNSPEDFRNYTMRDEAKYQDLLDRAAGQVMENEEFRGSLKSLVEKGRQKLGLRRYLLEAALHHREVTIAGAALAAVALLLWLLLGGISAGVLRSGFLPALLIAAVCAGAILYAAGHLAPAYSRDIDFAAIILQYI